MFTGRAYLLECLAQAVKLAVAMGHLSCGWIQHTYICGIICPTIAHTSHTVQNEQPHFSSCEQQLRGHEEYIVQSFELPEVER